MNFETSKQFDKLVYKMQDQSVKRRLRTIIERIAKAKSLEDVPNITPIVGYTGYYIIKFGDYRVGISVEDDTVWFLVNATKTHIRNSHKFLIYNKSKNAETAVITITKPR